MDKEGVLHIYSAIKENEFESVLVSLEPVIQSEGSQKEKSKYSVLMYVYGT